MKKRAGQQKSNDTKDNRSFRIVFIGVVFTLCLIGIGSRAFYLQVFQKDWLKEKASRQYSKSISSVGTRGTLFDSSRRELAVSITVTSVAVYPAKIKDHAGVAYSLAKALNLNAKVLLRRVRSKRHFVWIKRHVTPQEEKKVRELGFESVDFVPEKKRFYPSRTLAAQVIGFAGIDGRGLEGIEYHYNDFLKGGTDRFTVITDAMGRIFDTPEEVKEEVGGNNVMLTIDRVVQYSAEKALMEAVEENDAKSGIAVVMNPKTGALLALAHYPFFNPNDFGKFKRFAWRNRAITDAFEPGSTMKMFSIAAALEHGGLNQDTIFFCENGLYKMGSNKIRDTHSYGWLSIKQIIKYSSNIGVAKITENIGGEVLHMTLKDFGFGAKTGLDCPGETPGSLMNYRRWSRIDSGAISFGQGVSVSAVQLLSAVSAIANGGLLMKPYVVQEVSGESGTIIKSFKPTVVRRVISEKTASTVSRILETVTAEGGTGTNAALDGYRVCGKTGTAQKVDGPGGYANGKYIASFVGFVPAEDPEIAILVIVDEPQESIYGGAVAAPAFKKIARETLNYLNVQPQKGSMTVAFEMDGS